MTGVRNLRFLIIFLISIFIVENTTATLSKADSKNKKKSEEKGPTSLNVFDKKLVSTSIKGKDIATHNAAYHQDTSSKSTPGMVLAYVTPWNNHGYDVVKTFGGKFTHISPVWLQLRKNNQGYSITGTHDIDKGWVKEVKNASGDLKAKVVPRLLFEGWKEKDFRALVASVAETKKVIKEIENVLETFELDGIVVEVWSQLPSKDLLSQMPIVISHISLALRTAGYTFILVIPPPVYQRNIPGMFSDDLFNALVEDVDAFSLMTYDFSSFQNPGPNSPLWWVEECVKRLVPDDDDPNRKKILVGLNLYGLDHSTTGGSHILGNQVVDILKKNSVKFQYDEKSAEHFFEYKPTSTSRHTIFYPTLHSIYRRLQTIEKMNCGVSLWEVGQGLDYFYDLL